MDFSFHCVDASEHHYLWALVFIVKEGIRLVELGVLRVGFRNSVTCGLCVGFSEHRHEHGFLNCRP